MCIYKITPVQHVHVCHKVSFMVKLLFLDDTLQILLYVTHYKQ